MWGPFCDTYSPKAEEKNSIKCVCDRCNSENIDIMSVHEKTIECDGQSIPTVDINYICKDCGNGYTVNEFLYKE